MTDALYCLETFSNAILNNLSKKAEKLIDQFIRDMNIIY